MAVPPSIFVHMRHHADEQLRFIDGAKEPEVAPCNVVEWGFSYFLPQLRQICQHVIWQQDPLKQLQSIRLAKPAGNRFRLHVLDQLYLLQDLGSNRNRGKDVVDRLCVIEQ